MTSDFPAFAKVSISPIAYLQEAWTRVKGQYGVFLGVTLVGMLLGGAVPLGILLGPMLCGIYFCYRRQALGQPVTFDLLFKGFDYFSEAFLGSLIMVVTSMVVMVPLIFIFLFGCFATALGGAMGHGGENAASFLGCFLFAGFFLVVLLVSAVINLLFTFTFPLIMDRGMKGLDAVKLSIHAAMANFGGLLLLAVATTLLSLAGLLCCYVGALLVLPITLGSHWICYERVFGIQATNATQE